MDRVFLRVGVLLAICAALLAVFFTVVRPWYLQWGASDAEARMTLPGDGSLTGARLPTRGITIDVGADAIRPWLSELGLDRGRTVVIVPLDGYTTRLLVRDRAPQGGSMLARAVQRTIGEPLRFAIERQTLLEVKELAEGGDRHGAMTHLQIALWMVALALLAASAIAVLRRREWRRPLAAFAGAGIVFEVLTLTQPAVDVALLLVAAEAALLGPPTSRPPARLVDKSC
jgi:hypothetical protein